MDRSDAFGSTRWSVVRAAGGDGPAARAALETLCRDYWLPVYGFVRRRVPNRDDALDLTQGFFADLLERRSVDAAERSRGRFRAFLLTALKNYLANARAKAAAGKRGGGRPLLSLDAQTADGRLGRQPVDAATPDRHFERLWAVAVLDRALGRLEAEQAAAGRAAAFRTLRPLLTGDDGAEGYAAPARELGLTEQAARAAVYRLRKRYRDLLRDEIARTVSSPDEIDEELRRLFTAFDS